LNERASLTANIPILTFIGVASSQTSMTSVGYSSR